MRTLNNFHFLFIISISWLLRLGAEGVKMET